MLECALDPEKERDRECGRDDEKMRVMKVVVDQPVQVDSQRGGCFNVIDEVNSDNHDRHSAMPTGHVSAGMGIELGDVRSWA